MKEKIGYGVNQLEFIESFVLVYRSIWFRINHRKGAKQAVRPCLPPEIRNKQGQVKELDLILILPAFRTNYLINSPKNRQRIGFDPQKQGEDRISLFLVFTGSGVFVLSPFFLFPFFQTLESLILVSKSLDLQFTLIHLFSLLSCKEANSLMMILHSFTRLYRFFSCSSSP